MCESCVPFFSSGQVSFHFFGNDLTFIGLLHSLISSWLRPTWLVIITVSYVFILISKCKRWAVCTAQRCLFVWLACTAKRDSRPSLPLYLPWKRINSNQRRSICNSWCIWKIPYTQSIREKRTQTWWENLGHVILSQLRKATLDTSFCVRQGYDAAATMAGVANGLNAEIKKSAPLADYFHCVNHATNLSCSNCITVSLVRSA